MAMRYELFAVLREIWTSRALVPGACVGAYLLASLGIVVMNKIVLDTYQFPSTTIILSLQLAATLACVMGFTMWLGWPRERRRRVYGAVQTKGPSDRTLVKAAAPPLAILFLLDVALGHVASRALGLDAFAAFRRFNIPIAMHLEVFMRMAPWNRKIAAATWVMVLGPLLVTLLGRGRSTSAYETAAGLPSDVLNDAAHVFGAAATDKIVGRGNATRYVAGSASHGAARFEALSFDGCAAALCSACVAALRVVALRHVRGPCLNHICSMAWRVYARLTGHLRTGPPAPPRPGRRRPGPRLDGAAARHRRRGRGRARAAGRGQRRAGL